MWFPWSEIDKFGVIKSELTGKAYHKCQISKKCFGEIFASILRFMIFLRPGTEPKNGIMWFPCSEIDKFGGIKFFGPQEGLYQVSKHEKTFWNEFYIDS